MGNFEFIIYCKECGDAIVKAHSLSTNAIDFAKEHAKNYGHLVRLVNNKENVPDIPIQCIACSGLQLVTQTFGNVAHLAPEEYRWHCITDCEEECGVQF